MFLIFRIWICILLVGLCLYAYIDQHNAVTRLRLEIPALKRELKFLDEENLNLRYLIDQFESPAHLLRLAEEPRFGHLHFVSESEIIHVGQSGD